MSDAARRPFSTARSLSCPRGSTWARTRTHVISAPEMRVTFMRRSTAADPLRFTATHPSLELACPGTVNVPVSNSPQWWSDAASHHFPVVAANY